MNPLQMIMNAARRLDSIFPGYFPTAKHQHYKDFGYPDQVTFDLAFRMYSRHGIAKAAVNKTVLKTWQDFPALWETEQAGNTRDEQAILKHFRHIGAWRAMAEADRRAIVGGYAGLILRFADDQPFSAPVQTVRGGLEGLVELVPAWANQMTVSEWITDTTSPDYGKPKTFTFNEAAVDGKSAARSFTVHPDRVLIWSADGSVASASDLEAGYNALLDMEKVSGAGGEGFWKNAKSAPVLEIPPEVKINDMAKDMGVEPDDLVDAMNEQVEDWQKGFDKLLMLQGMQVKTLGVVLPSPEHFHTIPLLTFAASMGIPAKVLLGSQTGERASTEDAQEWAQTCMARRENIAKPRIKALADHLVRVGVLPVKDWYVGWTDLTEASSGEKLERAVKMSRINSTLKDEAVFLSSEIREQAGYDPKTTPPRYSDEDEEV